MSNTESHYGESAYQFINTQSELEEQVVRWQCADFLAIDTEFMRTNTYYAKPGLIQIADANDIYILDPLIVTDLTPLSVLLENPNIVKVMHSMSEDVELLFQSTGGQIAHVFDTQIAASFLGYGAALGYQKLVALVLEIELDKSETRSDWLKRPLTASQLEYAAKDAEYLVLLYQKLKSELVQRSLLDSAFNETEVTLIQTFESWRAPEKAYLKLRGGWELSVESQHLLRHLVIWRDNLARSENTPKSWIFSDALLIEMSDKLPRSAGDLKRLKGVQFKALRLYGEALLAELKAFDCEIDKDFIPIDSPVKGKELVLYKELKQVVSDVADKTGVSAQLLGSRKMLENVVIRLFRQREKDLPLEFQGWRKALLGVRMLEICSP